MCCSVVLHLVFETGHSQNLDFTNVDKLAGSRDLPVLASIALGLLVYADALGFFVCVGDLNSLPQSCMASNLSLALKIIYSWTMLMIIKQKV